MSQWPDWLKVVLPLVGSLLAVGVAALSAPVTANLLRLSRLDRLITVLDKMDTDDPARAYVAAEARKRAAWWAATTMTRMSLKQIGGVIFGLWFTYLTVKALIWPNPLLDWPLVFWWSKVWFLVIAVFGVLGILRRRRLERVNFYNSLIDAGPEEFALMLRKRHLVPRPRKAPKETDPRGLWRPDATQTGRALEEGGIRTCLNGHPLNGRSVFVTEYDLSKKPPIEVLCARCLGPIPESSLNRTFDQTVESITAAARRRDEKAAKRAAKKRQKAEPATDIAALDGSAQGSDGDVSA